MVGTSDNGSDEKCYSYSTSYQPVERKEFNYTQDPVFWVVIVPLSLFSLYVLFKHFNEQY